MPLRRPASPLSLETCPPTASDYDNDGWIGSDDEQDDAARAAQRNRVEKLAEAYLQGKPLFILSASLKGPFDKGWTNPWKKTRRHNETAERGEEIEPAESLVIQETEPRKRRHAYNAAQQEVQHSRSSCIAQPDPAIKSRAQSAVSLESSRDRKNQKSRRENRSRPSVSSHGTPKRSLPWPKESDLSSQPYMASISRDGDTAWLKKDRKRIGFQDFDPPTSPTTQFSARHADTKSRSTKASPLKRPSQPPGNSQSLTPRTTDRKQPTHSPAQTKPSPSRSEPIVDNHTPTTVKSLPPRSQRTSHSDRLGAATGTLNPETSLCVVSSSSQLPKFEYRRRKRLHENEHPESPSASVPKQQSTSPGKAVQDANKPNAQEEAAPKQPPPNQQSPSPRKAVQDVNPQEEAASRQSPSKYTTSHRQLESSPNLQRTFTSARGSHAIDSRTGSHLSKGQLTSHTTGENISEKYPSAQRVPEVPGVADNVTSLNSTAVPQGDPGSEGDTSPEAHFSTQAAVLLAQRSFQNDLDSPEQDHPATASGKKRRTSQSSVSPPHSKNITPFHRVNAPGDFGKRRHSKGPGTEGLPLMSTQYIMDAATPFTFSTERKPKARLEFSSTKKPSSKKRKKTSFQMSPSPSSGDQAQSTEDEMYSEPADASPGHSPQNNHQASTEHQNPQSESQTTGLPLALTGSTPTTAQDGQGGIENFNLSQAIADAGSWLQQSFDLNKDFQQCSNKKPGPSSSTDARRSALSLDTVQ